LLAIWSFWAQVLAAVLCGYSLRIRWALWLVGWCLAGCWRTVPFIETGIVLSGDSNGRFELVGAARFLLRFAQVCRIIAVFLGALLMA